MTGNVLKVLAVGDIVGKPGRDAIARHLPGMKERGEVDFAIGNAENVAGGTA